MQRLPSAFALDTNLLNPFSEFGGVHEYSAPYFEQSAMNYGYSSQIWSQNLSIAVFPNSSSVTDAVNLSRTPRTTENFTFSSPPQINNLQTTGNWSSHHDFSVSLGTTEPLSLNNSDHQHFAQIPLESSSDGMYRSSTNASTGTDWGDFPQPDCTKSEKTENVQGSCRKPLKSNPHLLEDNARGPKETSLQPTSQQGSKRYTCQECSKTFFRRCEVKKHSKSHVRQFKCSYPNCEQDPFALQKDLERHIRSAHSPHIRIACKSPGCDRTYTRRDNCSRHMTQKHRATLDLSEVPLGSDRPGFYPV